ncbi:MAG: tRNA (guanosine(37)-N1)-methyltransferase TrmD [Actinomycetota bacterium]
MSGKLSFDVISIFPEWFESPLKVGLLGKAIDSGVVSVGVHDLRDWGAGPHRKVDDAPFGGGPGMVMAAGPMVEAAEAVARPGAKILLTAAAGRPLTQGLVSELASREQIVILCGRYEGIDDRVRQVLGADEISIGEFVLSGGEVAALAIIEAVSRLVPGMVGRNISLSEESFGQGGLLEYPQYTRPAEFRGLRVPEVLLSGDHIQIARWRRREAIIKTAAIRPEHLEHSELSAEERAWAAGRD